MSQQFVVFGNPIEQSKSPIIHQLFAKQLHIELTYQKQLVALGDFKKAAGKFFEQGGLGANVTAPFKLDAYNFAEILTTRATLAGAVNSLSSEAGSIVGDNTDGIGWMRDMIDNLQQPLGNKRILIWGAGGAAQGLLQPLMEAGANSVSFYNRTLAKAQKLVELSRSITSDTVVDVVTDDILAERQFDVIVNSTSISLQSNLFADIALPQSIVHSSTFCYDLMYPNAKQQPTIFVQWAKQLGLKASDGLGMLVEQAAESFYLWHGVKPDTQAVIEILRLK